MSIIHDILVWVALIFCTVYLVREVYISDDKWEPIMAIMTGAIIGIALFW